MLPFSHIYILLFTFYTYFRRMKTVHDDAYSINENLHQFLLLR